jgi:ATP-dependent protease ClpP protease subunit
MRRLIFVLCLVFSLVPGAALASLDSSRAWFESLPQRERDAVQSDLLLGGYFGGDIGKQFDQVTYDAVVQFQRQHGGDGTGILTPAQRNSLRSLARNTEVRLGLRRVTDQHASVTMMIPANLLTRRTPTGVGTSYVSADGEISLETMQSDLSEVSFRELYNVMTEPDPERVVRYRNYTETRFVVAGTIGEYEYYSMFIVDKNLALGYSMAWGSQYSEEGGISAVWLASHFAPLSSLTPDEQEQVTADMPGFDGSAFQLPADDPDAIVLNAEITAGSPAEFKQALAKRPDARVLILNSEGGDVEGALVIAREVRRLGLKTYVPAGDGCYSACAYIFFAGENRIAKGELGVHQISQDVADIAAAQAVLGDVLDALDEFGVKHQVISNMLRTKPEDMYVFSDKEIAEFDINRGPPIAVARKAAKPAASDNGTPVTDVTALVQLSSRSTRSEADRSLRYAEQRWGKLFAGATPEIEAAADNRYQVRLPLTSVERANTICAAIKADGGGCYVTMPGR